MTPFNPLNPTPQITEKDYLNENNRRRKRHGGLQNARKAQRRCAREHGANLHITTFAEEPRPAYDRVHLSEYFSGRTADELSLAPLAWYDERGVDLRLGDKVTTLDRAAKRVETSSGETLFYDKLILATGSYPFVPRLTALTKMACSFTAPLKI